MKTAPRCLIRNAGREPCTSTATSRCVGRKIWRGGLATYVSVVWQRGTALVPESLLRT
jgi:hypothetical protein